MTGSPATARTSGCLPASEPGAGRTSARGVRADRLGALAVAGDPRAESPSRGELVPGSAGVATEPASVAAGDGAEAAPSPGAPGLAGTGGVAPCEFPLAAGEPRVAAGEPLVLGELDAPAIEVEPGRRQFGPQPRQPAREREGLLTSDREGRGVADVEDALRGVLAVAELRRAAVAQRDEDLAGSGAHQRRQRLAQVARLGRFASPVAWVALEARLAGIAVLSDPERPMEAVTGEELAEPRRPPADVVDRSAEV